MRQEGWIRKNHHLRNLAGALAELLKEVLVIESDPQGTVLSWRAAAGENSFPVQVMGLPRAVIHQ